MADIACAIAFCFSGAVRSFTQPRIHESIKTHLITGGLASQGCAWDTFFYLDAEDGAYKRCMCSLSGQTCRTAAQ